MPRKLFLVLLLSVFAIPTQAQFLKRHYYTDEFARVIYVDVPAADPQIPIITRQGINDYQCVPAPGNPPTGYVRLYCDSSTGKLTTIDSSGNSSSVGGSGVGSGASPIVGWYLGPNCPVANTGQCIYTPANTQVDGGCTWTGTTVTCADGPFVSTDVGKYIMGNDFGGSTVGGCSPFSNAGIAKSITTTHTTISAFVSATQVTIANTVAAASTGTVSCVIWGTPDDSGAAALDAAIVTSTSCPRITLSAGNYLFTTPHFFTNPASCYKLPQQFPFGNGSGNLGNMMLAAGMELEGRGIGATNIFLPPDFPETGACNHALYDTGTIQSCFAVTPLGYWHDFSIMGVPLASTGLPVNIALLQLGVGTIENFTCANVGPRVSGTVGITRSDQGQVKQVNLSNCGKIGMTMQASTGGPSGMYPGPTDFRFSVDNSENANVTIASGGVFRCDLCWFGGTQGTGWGSSLTVGAIFNHGGTVWIDNSAINQPKNGGLNNFPNGYLADTSGSVLYANNTTFEFFAGFAGQGNNGGQFGLACTAACTNYLSNNILQGSGKNTQTGAPYQDVAGSKLVDLGGNQFLCHTASGGTCNPPAPAGTVLAMGGGSNAGQITTAKTNFGTNLTAQTVTTAQYSNNLRVTVTLRQTTLGVGCGAGSNTVQGTLAWTTNGLAQTQTTSTLTISANGTVGTSVFQVLAVRPDANTAVTFTTTSVLASAGCSTIPQYQVDAVI